MLGPDGRPWPGAIVFLGDWGFLEDNFVPGVHTDAAGRFSFDSIPFLIDDPSPRSRPIGYDPGWRVVAFAVAGPGVLHGSAEILDGAGGELEVRLQSCVFEDAVGLLRLTDEQGRPVRSAVVQEADYYHPYDHPTTRRTVGDTGIVPLRRRDRHGWLIVVEAEGRDGPLAPGGLAWTWEPDSAPVRTLRLAPARSITGRLSLPDGSPAADHTVELIPPRTRDPFETEPVDAESWARTLWGIQPWRVTTETDDAGRFRFDGLAEGVARLSVSDVAGDQLPVEAEVVAGTQDLQLRLLPARRVEVRVLDELHRPLCDAVVRAEPGDGATTNSDGVAWIDHVPSAAATMLTVSAEQRVPVRIEVVAAEVGPLEVVLRPGATIVGRVLAPDGRPVPFARVLASGSTVPEESREAVWRDDGRFEIIGLPTGNHPVELRLLAGEVELARTIAVAGEEGVELEWEDSRCFTLAVPVTPHSWREPGLGRRHVARVKERVELRSGGDLVWSGWCGAVACPDVPPETGVVDVRITSFLGEGLTVHREGIEATGFHRLQPVEGSRVMGMVRRPDGRDPGSLDGVLRLASGFEVEGWSSPGGSFVFSGVPPGRHTIEFRAHGLLGTRTVEVASSVEQTRVVVELEPVD